MNQVGFVKILILFFSTLFLLTGFNYQHEKKAELIGPNCWNASLVASRVVSYHRYINDKEFAFYMKSPLCRALSNEEARLTGDIGSISLKSKIPRGAGGVEHAFVYFNETLIYSKKNPLPQHTFKLSPISDLRDSFSLIPGSNCFLNQSHPNCKVRTTFYRCQGLEDYLVSRVSRKNDSILALQLFEKIEMHTENLVMKKMINTESMQQSMSELQALLETSNSAQEMSDADKLIWQVLFVRVNSVIDQFRALRDDYPQLLSVFEPELWRIQQRLLQIQPAVLPLPHK